MRSLILACGYLVASWLFHRQPVLVAVRADDDPVARLRRMGAL